MISENECNCLRRAFSEKNLPVPEETLEKGEQRCLPNDISETRRQTDEMQGAECVGAHAVLFPQTRSIGCVAYGENEKASCVSVAAVSRGPLESSSSRRM